VLLPQALDGAKDERCPQCAAELRGRLFPAWWVEENGAVTTSEPALPGEAVCFFHPSNRAALPCDLCGRFLCTICDLPIGARHLCPVCLSHGLGKEKLPEVIPRRFLWSWASFWLGVVPLLAVVVAWPVMFVTGALGILTALVGWNRPGSLVRGHQHWAAVVGVLLGLSQIVISVGVFYILFAARPR
jgi:hypothetical protein